MAGAARPDGAALWCGDAALALLRPVEALCAEGRAQHAQPALLASLLAPAAAPASPRGTAAMPGAVPGAAAGAVLPALLAMARSPAGGALLAQTPAAATLFSRGLVLLASIDDDGNNGDCDGDGDGDGVGGDGDGGGGDDGGGDGGGGAAWLLGLRCLEPLSALFAQPALVPQLLPPLLPLLAKAAAAATRLEVEASAAERCGAQVALALGGRALCGTLRGVWALPAALLRPVALSLRAGAAAPAPPPDLGARWAAEAGADLREEEAEEAAEAAEAAALCASLIASRPEGLMELSAAGVVARRAAALVRCAQAEARGCDTLHEPPPPGAHAWPLLRDMRSLLTVLAWPHATPLALGARDHEMHHSAPHDRAGGGDAAVAELRVAGLLGPLRRLVVVGGTGAAAVGEEEGCGGAGGGGDGAAFPLNFFESHAAGLLLATLLCGDVQTALLLRSELRLVTHLRRLHRAAPRAARPPPLPLREGAEGAAGAEVWEEGQEWAAASEGDAQEEQEQEGEQVGEQASELEGEIEPEFAQIASSRARALPTAALDPESAWHEAGVEVGAEAEAGAEGEAEAGTEGDEETIADLNSVCRARLLTSLLQWGVSTEWSLPPRSLVRSALYSPLQGCGAGEIYRDDDAHGGAAAVRRASGWGKAAAAGLGAAAARGVGAAVAAAAAALQEEAALKGMIGASPRMQAASGLLLARGSAADVKQMLGALRGRLCAPVAEADALDAPELALPPLRLQSPPPPRGGGGDAPCARTTGAVLFCRYARRAARLRRDPAVLCATLQRVAAGRSGGGGADGAAGGGTHAEAPFDPLVAISFALLGARPGATEIFLRRLSVHACCAYVWPARAEQLGLRNAPSLCVLRLAEEMIPTELPLLHAALRHAALPAALPMARWLQQSWLNVLPFASLRLALLLPLFFGADFAIYLCVAALQHVQPTVARRAHTGDALLFLLDQPLQRFDVAAAIPYMLDLRERWRGRCLREMAEALQEPDGA